MSAMNLGHLKVIENYDNMFLVKNLRENKIVEVKWEDGKIIANDKDPQYVLFASLYPGFRLV